MLHLMTLLSRKQMDMVPGRLGGWHSLEVTHTHSSEHGRAGSVHGCLEVEDAALDAGRTLGPQLCDL